MAGSKHLDWLARPTTLDLIEKVVVSGLLGVLAARMIPAAMSSGNVLPVIPGESHMT